jgi:hypothetical protein
MKWIQVKDLTSQKILVKQGKLYLLALRNPVVIEPHSLTASIILNTKKYALPNMYVKDSYLTNISKLFYGF